MMLTNRQKEELNNAVFEYLKNNDYENTAETFMSECGDELTKSSQMKNVLEKKWVSIIRLSKKISQLESEVVTLREELESVSKMKRTSANAGDTDSLFPKFPPTHKFSGHKGVVNNVAFHPVYSTVASVGEDASIKLWDFESGKYEGSLKGHTETINDLAFDPNGQLLATCSSDFSIKLWDLDAKICTKTLTGHDHVVSSVDFKPSGDFLMSASRDQTVKLWELSTGYCTKTWQAHEEWVRVAVFNEKGTLFATGSNDQTLKLWNLNQDEELFTFYGHEHVIETVIFVKGDEGRANIYGAKWNSEGPKEKQKMGIKEMIEQSKKKLAQGLEEAPVNPIENLEFLISGSRDKVIRIWSCQTAACLKVLSGHDSWVRGLSLHHSGKYIYSCSDDKSVRIWSIEKGKTYRKIEGAHGHFVSGITSHPVYLVVATCCVDSSVAIWQCK